MKLISDGLSEFLMYVFVLAIGIKVFGLWGLLAWASIMVIGVLIHQHNEKVMEKSEKKAG